MKRNLLLLAAAHLCTPRACEGVWMKEDTCGPVSAPKHGLSLTEKWPWISFWVLAVSLPAWAATAVSAERA
jgi:hypothetical protein